MSDKERPDAKLVERIRKILSKTQEQGCTEAEAATAFAMANKLLAEHALSMDDIRCQGGDDGESYVQQEAFSTGRWTAELNHAYAILERFFFVRGIFGGNRGNQRVLYLFGTEANVATARFTFNALLASAERLWVMYRYLNKRPANEARLFKTGLFKGFADKLDEERRAMEMERDLIKGASGGTELALRRVEDQTMEKFKERNPSTRQGRSHFADFTGDKSTLQAGYEAGRKMTLNRAIGGKGRRALG